MTTTPLRQRLQAAISTIVIAPSVLLTLVFVYGFIAWTMVISFTGSRMLPQYDFVGLEQYRKLWAMERWEVALTNLALFGTFFIIASLAIGLLLAMLLDQRIRMENVLRTIFLYPMALSFIVTGTIWKWILNPGLGIEKQFHVWGFISFKFDWLVNPNYAIYTVVLAGVWQASGLVMALVLAALRSVDQDVIKAAYLHGASMPRIYWGIILPSIRPVFMSAIVVLAHLAIKSFDLVVSLTNGGPGYATDLPATFMYAMTFQRNQMGLGSASAMMMLCTIMAIIVPYLYSELRAEKSHGIR